MHKPLDLRHLGSTGTCPRFVLRPGKKWKWLHTEECLEELYKTNNWNLKRSVGT